MNKSEQLIACLECEIAKRDEELAACRVAVENCDLFRARIVELEARIVWLECEAQADKPSYASQMAKRWGSIMPEAQGDAWAPSGEDYDRSIHRNPDAKAWADFFVATFPGLADKHDLMLGWFANAMMAMHDHLLSKAQGVVQWPGADEIMQMAFEEGQPADDASGYYFELEEFDLFIDRLMSEVARLNTAPAQQVSVPDGWRELAKRADDFLYSLPETDGVLRLRADLCSMLAAPAAPVADAGLVEAFCKVEQALDLIGGIRHGKNVTQDELWQSCELLDAAIAAHRAKGVV